MRISTLYYCYDANFAIDALNSNIIKIKRIKFCINNEIDCYCVLDVYRKRIRMIFWMKL